MTTPDTTKCSCGHFVEAHRFLPATKTRPKRRGQCTHMDEHGQCECRYPR